MSTFRQVYYHLVFGTKHSEPTLTPAHHEELYRFIWGVVKNRQGHVYRINGAEDHLHLFTDLHPSMALADLVKEIKVASRNWMKASGLFPRFIHWQEGYGAFTCSVKERDAVIA